jgi:phage shock protein C
MKGRKFQLDRGNGKFMGVCAGLGNYLGVDPTFVRIAAVVVTLAGAFPWTLIAYGITAWAAGRKRGGASPGKEAGPMRMSTFEYKHGMRDIDRRLAEVDSYVASSNTSLAREIEELR